MIVRVMVSGDEALAKKHEALAKEVSSRVEEILQTGKIEEVAHYCAIDVLNT